MAFELAWVDAGAATGSLAGCLALSPIHERGTAEQRDYYMSRCAPPQPGEDRKIWRGAFCLTEPIPYVGVETGMLGGKVRIAEWEEGEEPMLQVDKRGRFITNMGFANFVTAAVESDDPRIKGSCMVVLEETDPGTFDRGTPTRKLVHQLSSTRDPIFSLQVPASRIIGGYTVKDGVIVPNYSHGEIIEAVFRRTRVRRGADNGRQAAFGGRAGDPVSARAVPRRSYGHARLAALRSGLAAQAGRGATPGGRLGYRRSRRLPGSGSGPRVRRTGPPGAGKRRGSGGARHQRRHGGLQGHAQGAEGRHRIPARQAVRDLAGDVLVRYALLDSVANVLCPACKLWNTGQGANMMREAVSLMGGYGITEDCPGFLGHKWMDAQLEATYEGPRLRQEQCGTGQRCT